MVETIFERETDNEVNFGMGPPNLNSNPYVFNPNPNPHQLNLSPFFNNPNPNNEKKWYRNERSEGVKDEDFDSRSLAQTLT